MVEWFSIEEKPPAEDIDIMISARGVVAMAQFRSHYDGMKYWSCPDFVLGYDCELDFQKEEITHWAYVPKAPKNTS